MNTGATGGGAGVTTTFGREVNNDKRGGVCPLLQRGGRHWGGVKLTIGIPEQDRKKSNQADWTGNTNPQLKK